MKNVYALLLLSASSGCFAQGYLENPVINTTESGISIVSGWHCTATNVRIYIDGQDYGYAGAGTNRFDTEPVCGHHETGFSRLINWNVLQPGAHVIEVYADDILLESRPFKTTRSAIVPFATGINKTFELSGFPAAGQSVKLTWNEAKQSFVVTETDAHANSSDDLEGSYSLYRTTLQDVDGEIIDTEQPNFDATGTFTINDGWYTQNISIRLNGFDGESEASGRLVDNGYYFYDPYFDSSAVIVKRGDELITSNLNWVDGFGYLNEIDYWILDQ